MLTSNQLQAIVTTLSPAEAAAMLPSLTSAMDWAEINTAPRIGGFLSQCAHESAGFKVFSENLNYSAQGLLKTFGKYFNPTTAQAYSRQPQRIANRVYANRLGNGDEASGDGWRYRGRGAIQCTGKDKYVTLTDLFAVDFVNNPDLLATLQYAFLSAAWYWKDRRINALADAKDIRKMTVAVNGGLNGYDDRLAYYTRARRVLSF